MLHWYFFYQCNAIKTVIANNDPALRVESAPNDCIKNLYTISFKYIVDTAFLKTVRYVLDSEIDTA